MTPPAFTASTDAVGVLVNETVPGAPGTDNPIDSGGPTAQASLDSIGDTSSYAAFPDPGQFVVSLPGLATGLLGSGVAGLPPVNVPTLPSYPFDVSANNLSPQASIGGGPYALSATADQSNAAATASAGLEAETAGNAALLKTNSSVTVKPDGSIVATASTDIEGLTIGPLTIGQIQAVSTETISSDGTMSNQPSLTITGAKIGNLPVAITTTGLQIGPVSAPLPLGSLVSGLLAPFGVTASILSPSSANGTLTAPALQITQPIPNKELGVGSVDGRSTMTLGYAAVTLQAGASSPSGATPGSSASAGSASPQDGQLPAGTSAPLDSSSGTTNSAVALPASSSPAIAGPLATPTTPGPGPAGGSTPGSTPSRATALGAPTSARFELVGSFDIRNLYLIFVVAAAAAFIVSQVIRRKGVRGPWSSSG